MKIQTKKTLTICQLKTHCYTQYATDKIRSILALNTRNAKKQKWESRTIVMMFSNEKCMTTMPSRLIVVPTEKSKNPLK